MTDINRTALDNPVRVHGSADADAALAAASTLGVPVVLASAPGAGAHAGALWFRLMVEAAQARWPAVAVTAVLDCGDRAGDAQGALAAGVRHVLFRGPPDVAARLADIAAQRGARILTALPDSLDLRGARDSQAACSAWLARPGRSGA